ncbi:MAG TPA: Bax inhibitor-1/YccA family protein [Gemmatimonadales bacterium]|nr:Bax inhibitor-1/YccA family protein [Gemmatimonadales bacterium]
MANPLLNDKAFQRADQYTQAAGGEVMSVEGAINKTALLLLLVIAGATWVWTRYFQTQDPAVIMPYMVGGLVVGIAAALATIFAPTWARISAPVYAAAEGLALGGISALYEQQLHGIVFQAIGLTFGVLAVMLVLYRSGIIKVTDRFRMIVFAATGGIALFYLVTIVLGFFHISVPLLSGGGTGAIVFSLVVVGIAALNLAIDFDFIARGAEHGAPKFMEWYAAFGLMVTLIWLYLEILRLLANVRRR